MGSQLAPPASLERLRALPPWAPRTIQVEGTAWDRSTVDVAIAGLGWVAVGVKGPARLRVWAPASVAVTSRPALIPDYAKDFCRPGMSVVLPASASGGAGKKQGGVAAPKQARAAPRRPASGAGSPAAAGGAASSSKASA